MLEPSESATLRHATIIPVGIYEEITRLRREGRGGALATIINARGSIPSFASAKMA